MKPKAQYGTRRIYENESGNFVVEVTTITHHKGQAGDIMTLWVKNGRLPEFIPQTLHVATYYTDEQGNCWGRYNRTVKKKDGGSFGYQIDFDWVLAATEANERLLVSECERLMQEDLKDCCVAVSVAASMLGVSTSRIYKLIDNGTLKAERRDGRKLISVSSIDEYAASDRKAGRPRNG